MSRTLDPIPSPSVGLTHLDLNLEPAGGRETNVDDLWDDRDEVRLCQTKLSIDACSGYQLNVLETSFTQSSKFLSTMLTESFQVRAVQMAYVPPHERTQEIDIDAMLDYSDSQDETDEGMIEMEDEDKNAEAERNIQEEEYRKRQEEEMAGRTKMMEKEEQSLGIAQSNFDHHHESLDLVQEEVNHNAHTRQEQLDDEQRRLEEERNYLEMQNLALQQQLEAGEELLAVEAREGSEGSDGASSVIVKEGADLNYSLLAKQEAEWRAVARRDGRIRPRSAAEERRAGESFFNFRSFRKPKNKNKVPNQPMSLEDSAMSSSSDDRKEDKGKKGLGGVFNMQKAKKRPASYHPKGNQEKVAHQNRFSLKDSPTSCTDESNEEAERQDEVVTESSDNILEDDLASQIVREIQKSTTELNIKSRSLPKLGKGSERSVFGAAALRFSMKKSKKRNVDEIPYRVDETNGHDANVEVVNIHDVEREESDQIQHEERMDENSDEVIVETEDQSKDPSESLVPKRREKKGGGGGFGDLFRSKSGKIGETNQVETDHHQEYNEDVLDTEDHRERSQSMKTNRDRKGGAGGLGEIFRSKSGKIGEHQQIENEDHDAMVNGEDTREVSNSMKSKREKRGGGIGDMFRARSGSRGRSRKKELENADEETGKEEFEQRKSPGIFGSLRRGKSRTRIPQPQEEVTGGKNEDVGQELLQAHPDVQDQEEHTMKESPDRESYAEEAVAKGRKSPGGGLGSLFFGKGRDRAPPLPSSPPPATPTETTSSFLRSATTQKSVRRPGVRQPPALRPLDRPPPPPQTSVQEMDLPSFQNDMMPQQQEQPNSVHLSNPLQELSSQIVPDFNIKEADQYPNKEASPQSQESALRQPSSLPIQPSLHLREPSPLPREPSPLHREDASPLPTSLEPQQRLQEAQESVAVEKSRQKGRQSGRFRKSATTSSLSAAAPTHENPAQTRVLNTLVRPEEVALGKSNATVGRTESYRRARGEQPPKRGDSLPRRGRPMLPRATSEDSVREAIARQEANRSKEKNDCSVM